MLDVVRRQAEAGRSVIFISHRLLEISALCDRATVLRDGETVGVVDMAPGAEERIVELMLGATVERRGMPSSATSRRRGARRRTPPRVQCPQLRVGTKLEDVSFDLFAGEVLGVVALEGQGQAELFGVLSGSIAAVRRHDRGERPDVQFGLRPTRSAQARLVPGDRTEALLMQRSVRENIALPFSARPRAWGPIARAMERAQVDGAIERLQIDTRAQSEVERLSGGNQQKVTIARWIAAGARTILCFDPTRGIDIRTKRESTGSCANSRDRARRLLYTSELEEVHASATAPS